MNPKVIYNSDLHYEHVQWKKELLFWIDEIQSFQNRISEISNRWTDEIILAELGQYHHDFNLQNKTIKKLINEIEAHEHNISKHLEAQEDCIDRVHLKHHEAFRYNLVTERNMYNDLKNRFYAFLSKYL